MESSETEQFLEISSGFGPDEIPYSFDEVISVIGGIKEEAELILDLMSDEDNIVTNLFQALYKLEKPLGLVSVEPKILNSLGEIELANLTKNGRLILIRRDGELKIIDLTNRWNRDLLVKVVKDLAPKLIDVIDNPPLIEKPIVQETELEDTSLEEHLELKTRPIKTISKEVQDTKVDEEFKKKPSPEKPTEVELLPGSQHFDKEKTTKIEEQESTVELETEMEPVLVTKDKLEELPIKINKLEDRVHQMREMDADILQYKKRVDSETKEIAQQMAEVKRQRLKKIKILREVNRTPEKTLLEKPFKSFIRRFFSRIFRKRR